MTETKHVQDASRVDMTTLSALESLSHATSVGQLFEASTDAAAAYMQLALGPTPIPGVSEDLMRFLDETNPAHTTRKRLLNAIKFQDFQGVDTTSAEYFTLVEATGLRNQLTRKLIRTFIAKEKPTFLDEVGLIYLEKGMQIQDIVGKLSLAWRRDIAFGKAHEAFAKLEELQATYKEALPDVDSKLAFKTYIEPLIPDHGDFLYVLPRIAEGSTDENPTFEVVPYVEAFPEEISEMTRLMDEMSQDLQQYAQAGDKNAQGLIATHQALAALLRCTEGPARQNELGKALDKAFVNGTHTGTITLIPPMEVYGDPWKMLVELEYTIAFEDERYKVLNDEADQAQQALIGYLEEKLEDEESPLYMCEVLKESLKYMKNARAKFYAMLREGNTYESIASNIPNNTDMRFEVGTVINMSHASYERKMQISENLIQTLLKKVLADPNTTIEHQSIHVALHEDGHSLLVAPDTIKRLTNTVYSDLEEAKSDIIGLVGGLYFFRNDIARRKEFILAELCMNLRGLTRWQERDDRTHFNGNTLCLDLMIETGILVQSDKENNVWEFPEPSPENMDRLFKAAEKVLGRFAEVYQARDPRMAQHLMDDLFTEEHVLPLAIAAEIDTSEPKA